METIYKIESTEYEHLLFCMAIKEELFFGSLDAVAKHLRVSVDQLQDMLENGHNQSLDYPALLAKLSVPKYDTTPHVFCMASLLPFEVLLSVVLDHVKSSSWIYWDGRIELLHRRHGKFNRMYNGSIVSRTKLLFYLSTSNLRQGVQPIGSLQISHKYTLAMQQLYEKEYLNCSSVWLDGLFHPGVYKKGYHEVQLTHMLNIGEQLYQINKELTGATSSNIGYVYVHFPVVYQNKRYDNLTEACKSLGVKEDFLILRSIGSDINTVLNRYFYGNDKGVPTHFGELKAVNSEELGKQLAFTKKELEKYRSITLQGETLHTYASIYALILQKATKLRRALGSPPIDEAYSKTLLPVYFQLLAHLRVRLHTYYAPEMIRYREIHPYFYKVKKKIRV